MGSSVEFPHVREDESNTRPIPGSKAAPTLAEDDAEDAKESRNMDPELRKVGQILRMLDKMEPCARARVVAYLTARYVIDPRD